MTQECVLILYHFDASMTTERDRLPFRTPGSISFLGLHMFLFLTQVFISYHFDARMTTGNAYPSKQLVPFLFKGLHMLQMLTQVFLNLP